MVLSGHIRSQIWPPPASWPKSHQPPPPSVQVRLTDANGKLLATGRHTKAFPQWVRKMVMAAESSTDPSKMMTSKDSCVFCDARMLWGIYAYTWLMQGWICSTMPFGIICQPRHPILHTQNLEMLSPEIQTADRFAKVQTKRFLLGHQRGKPWAMIVASWASGSESTHLSYPPWN